VPEPPDRPIERSAKGRLHPWISRRRLPGEDVRLYDAEQVLSVEARHQGERSNLAKAIAALTADRTARDRYRATPGPGSAPWLCAPSHDRAGQLVGMLADYNHSWLRYDSEGVEVIRHNPNDSTGNAARRGGGA
jgi:hypothetical protein